MPEAYLGGDEPHSYHFVPVTLLVQLEQDGGADPRINQAGMVVYDLEDSVRPEDKEEARAWLLDYMNKGRTPAGVRYCVRVNEPGSPWRDADIQAFGDRVPLIVPKIRSLDDVPETDQGVIPIIETVPALGIVPDLAELRGADGRRQVTTVLFGKEDLSVALGLINTDPNTTDPIPSPDLRRNSAMRDLFSYIRWGSEHDLRIIDGVTRRLQWNQANLADLAAESKFAQILGAVGKLTIHFSQISVVNDVFAQPVQPERPSRVAMPELEQDLATVPRLQEKLATALRIIEAFETNQRTQNITVVEIDGNRMMIGPPAYLLASHIVERAVNLQLMEV